MEQALLVEGVLEQEEVWEEVEAEAGWEVPDLVLVPAVSVYVRPVELLYLIKWGHPAIKWCVQTVAHQW